MPLILDTSAVIGWVELQDAAVIEALREYSHDGNPRVHAVTIGELERGVTQAPESVTQGRRRETLRFAREQLAPVNLEYEGLQPEAFGHVAAAVSRKISHNDTWIVAAAVTERRDLLTQDAALAERAVDAATSSPLSQWLTIMGFRLNVIHVPRQNA